MKIFQHMHCNTTAANWNIVLVHSLFKMSFLPQDCSGNCFVDVRTINIQHLWPSDYSRGRSYCEKQLCKQVNTLQSLAFITDLPSSPTYKKEQKLNLFFSKSAKFSGKHLHKIKNKHFRNQFTSENVLTCSSCLFQRIKKIVLYLPVSEVSKGGGGLITGGANFPGVGGVAFPIRNSIFLGPCSKMSISTGIPRAPNISLKRVAAVFASDKISNLM